MRCYLLLVCLGLFAVPRALADRAEELAWIHIEAIGGRERIQALSAFRATGTVVAGGKRVAFTLTAARPNRLRLETASGGRTLVQATDGKEAPWSFDTGQWPPRYLPMADDVARTFLADAEFDDPLVAGADRGYTFSYSGEVEMGARKMLRLIVTRAGEAFALLLDPETYCVAYRIDQRKAAGGKASQIITRYDDFRPVEGVLIPHEVITMVDNRVTQQAKIEQVVPNPKLGPETFARPQSKAETPK